ncbi:hypothetical protein LEP1GSC008_2683 [Leptospira kirschneri serovar Bulgarica str. Nikolaevo]|uniref:Uncharacterized protein n=1 Tax=Leptospira kirschneri serovar Bulgarica str. Nikolaevo TaxID=1240687 RepID=M6F700_9LEPT|nr:hypothetical protein LEP1GSC008_2683 [Leptospira kirschneri serovar Bulgarica str. Nikolaevo]
MIERLAKNSIETISNNERMKFLERAFTVVSSPRSFGLFGKI